MIPKISIFISAHVQVICIVFSLITMAVVASSYQRFESQKVVGRNYPWSSEVQCMTRQKQFRQTKSILEEPKPVEPTYVEIPGSEQIMNRFKSINQSVMSSDDEDEELNATMRYHDHKSMHLGDFNLNKENNFTFNDQHKNIDFDELDGDTNKRRQTSKILNIPVDENRPRRPSLLDLNAIVEHENESNNGIDDNNQTNLDFSPDHPPPPPPHLKDFIFNQFNRFSTFKDMLVMNAELYIKEHVPRLPDKLFEHENSHKSPMDKMDEMKPDEVDFIMPSRKKIIEGIEQEDIVAKSVAFTAWTFFLVMRMVSLSAFSVFFPLECTYLCIAHYLVMVACLFYETRFHEKIERTYFYLFLAYIYIFCILEFKIKFKRPRIWFVLYTTLMLLQTVAITVAWYYFAEFESWWFGYMFAIITLSFCYSLLCFLVFYFLLKPADKILYENND